MEMELDVDPDESAPLPLEPMPESEASGIKQALVTFSLSALLGAGALVTLAPVTHTRGASRAARIKAVEVREELARAERSLSPR